MNYKKIEDADEAKLRKTLVHIISLLVNKMYREIEVFTEGRDLDATTIQSIMNDWPSPLVMPPSDRLEDLIYTTQSIPSVPSKDICKSWLIDALLYSQSEGRSDLTLKLVLMDSARELYQVIVEDLGVM